ncbi:Hypothetical protein SRAE_1000249000 [Strongyloides ratti]|uniref:Uncharacterized protein n=1 Tax=Strongyloides ratti TaxID=34506 RepID=A0A090L9T1_STRRB|nr:Hypothetical protein SRAE_1000249000 [Strongyloides ratti]CEF64235.1 Hypothetical protein SRAE_1000249000 [Strongyloides ratti]
MVNFYGLTIKNDYDKKNKKKDIIIFSLIVIIFILIILFVLFFVKFYNKKSDGCKDGLVPLIYKDTSEFIQCHKNATYDSCSFISQNELVECSKNGYKKLNVCCGSPELLIQILTTISIGHFNSLGKRKIEEDNKIIPNISEGLVNNINGNTKNNEHLIPFMDDLIKVKSNYLNNPESVISTSTENFFDSKKFVNRLNYPTNYDAENNLFLQKKENSIKIDIDDEDLNLKIGKNGEEKENSMIFEVETGPVLSILSNGLYYPGNITNLWYIETSVVLLKEDTCTVIVNTGMPHQKNDIKDSLISKNIFENEINYTIITNSLIFFIGNIELFPSQNLVLETNLANKDAVMSILWYEMPLYKLCSPNLSIIKTPGVTDNSITVVAKNVPGMGTVAVGGSLFFSDKNLFKIERNFIQNDTALLNSRKKIVCLSDWIVPAYGNPVIVTKKMKYDMSC